MTKHCHVLVAATAKELAAAMFEDLAQDNEFYRRNPSQRKFVAKYWKDMVPQARATLASMLAGPLASSLKDSIEDALIMDNELRHMPGA